MGLGRTELDGPHVDVRIATWEQHQGWNIEYLIYDIAMIKLAQDIIFNGKLFRFNMFIKHLSENTFIFILNVERVKPVCLPFDSNLINQRFVGHSPFVTGWSVIFSFCSIPLGIIENGNFYLISTGELPLLEVNNHQFYYNCKWVSIQFY